MLLSASTITGDDVVNGEGEDLGTIEEIMFDPDEGEPGYAVLSFGGVLGMGDKLFAVPWKALTPQMNEHRFVLNVPREELEKAPGFDKDDWPKTAETWAGFTRHWEPYRRQ